MSHEVISAVIRGATGFVNEADEKLKAALAKHGPDKPVSFPVTAFCMPMACALMGIEAKKLSDLQSIVEHCKEILPPVPTKELWLPYLGNGLDAGAATLLASEVTCALRYLDGEKIEDGFEGFMSDTILRELGIQLVDGRMPGFAAILGAAPTSEIAAAPRMAAKPGAVPSTNSTPLFLRMISSAAPNQMLPSLTSSCLV